MRLVRVNLNKILNLLNTMNVARYARREIGLRRRAHRTAQGGNAIHRLYRNIQSAERFFSDKGRFDFRCNGCVRCVLRYGLGLLVRLSSISAASAKVDKTSAVANVAATINL